ncbi:MAG: lytic transglycosylase domain-containing protein [Candidatus Sulfotelmatobacter sp.]|jgi:soluble lytic murein transglycosylase-like protein
MGTQLRAHQLEMNKLFQLALLIALALPGFAADSAVLRNGFSIRHQRRQVLGSVTRLYIDGDQSSFVDIPTAEIDHFESLPDPPTPAPTRSPRLASAAQNPFDLNQAVRDVSGTYQLDPDLVTSVIRAESGFNVHAVSPKGAQGLMQLMPQTASQLGVRNAFDPQANVEAGTRYLRELLERYNFDLIKALAAYNAGPERVEQYNGVPPYYETKAYVARIVRDFNKKKIAAKSASSSVAAKKRTSSTPVPAHGQAKSNPDQHLAAN